MFQTPGGTLLMAWSNQATTARRLVLPVCGDPSARGVGFTVDDANRVLADNSARLFEVYWAALRCGLVLTAVNHHLTPAEVEKGCDTVIAGFADVPDDGDISYRVGWLSFPPDNTAWELGDRAVRCFLWNNGETMTGSYRKAGPGKLRIHYTYR